MRVVGRAPSLGTSSDQPLETGQVKALHRSWHLGRTLSLGWTWSLTFRPLSTQSPVDNLFLKQDKGEARGSQERKGRVCVCVCRKSAIKCRGQTAMRWQILILKQFIKRTVFSPIKGQRESLAREMWVDRALSQGLPAEPWPGQFSCEISCGKTPTARVLLWMS